VIEHNRLGDAAASVRKAQFDIRIAQSLDVFRKAWN
jgi:hypothetical protein